MDRATRWTWRVTRHPLLAGQPDDTDGEPEHGLRGAVTTSASVRVNAGIDRFAFPVDLTIADFGESDDATGHGRPVDLRQPMGEFAPGGGMGRVSGQVVPLMGVRSQIVEFLGAVGITDVTPPFGTDAVIVLSCRGDRRQARGAFASLLGVLA